MRPVRPERHLRNDRHLSVHDLKRRISEGEIDTVVVACTDMQGRLQGKRMHAVYFVDHVLEHGTEGCGYLLSVDIEMNPAPGYARSSWERGYGDMEFALDLDTLRLLPHHPGTALVQCDLVWLDQRPVEQSPRTVLRRQIEAAAELGYVALAGSELEFMIFDTSYEAAWTANYSGLVPANQYNVDYSIVGGSRVEPLLQELRNHLYAAGMNVESVKGEGNLGQHEIGFLYDEAMITADNHAVYKTMAKEVAAQRGRSITFMAKYDEREGNSCHIHLSLRGTDGSPVFADGAGRSVVYDHFVAGLLTTMADFTLLYAPNVNSYKRFADALFAPTPIAWGTDNRTCAVRLLGSGPAARLENRVPGGDVNPYLGIAAMIAGGLHGIREQLPLEPELVGNAHASPRPAVPHTLRAARDAFADSAIARAAFGDVVVDHYTHMADTELTAFESAVTDWERRRGFERM